MLFIISHPSIDSSLTVQSDVCNNNNSFVFDILLIFILMKSYNYICLWIRKVYLSRQGIIMKVYLSRQGDKTYI